MKIKLKGLMIMGAIALGQVGEAWAADANPPERMTYQGYLVDGNGAALAPTVPANYDIVFRIYNVKSGGVALWAEQQTVTVDKGYFSVLLGEGATTATGESKDKLSEAFKGADISDRFIGITVGGLSGSGVDVEIAPRLRLVTSPFAFTATQATRLTDGAGNSNFFKDGASLKLGAGATPTLTLPEAGGASLEGKLTINLSGYEVGLEINNGVSSTTLGAENSSHFHFKTDRGGFYFNKEIRVFGDIHSQNADTILGPSNNTDTYLQVYDDSSDKIMARADQFLVQGDSYHLQMKFSSNQVDLETNASKFNMNKPLTVNGALSVSGLDVGGAINATGNVTRNGQPLVRVDQIAVDEHPTDGNHNHNGGRAVRSDNFTVTGDPVMLFISGSTIGSSVAEFKLRVNIYETSYPYASKYQFDIRQWHNTSGTHRSFSPINRMITGLVKGKGYFVQIRSINALWDSNDPFHIVVTQYNNQ
jgi:hypothetical protein